MPLAPRNAAPVGLRSPKRWGIGGITARRVGCRCPEIMRQPCVLNSSDGAVTRTRGPVGRASRKKPPALAGGVVTGMLLGQLQPVRRVVGWPRPPLILAVFGDEQPALEGMIGRRKAQAERVAVAPREGLNGVGRLRGVEARPQDGAGAHARPGGPLECLHNRPWSGDAMVRISTGQVAVARVKQVLAERDVLTRD